MWKALHTFITGQGCSMTENPQSFRVAGMSQETHVNAKHTVYDAFSTLAVLTVIFVPLFHTDSSSSFKGAN